ncbi:MAG: adenosylcobalamin-dependent ribonucleoside-diphosphate reductase [Nanoarchaeota archaeon]|nr:adenosylcobalamin-dependent ribonucleoside-diphosphate reductase [Nanoarchaeota archaeon]
MVRIEADYATLKEALIGFQQAKAKELGRTCPIRTGNFAYKVGEVQDLEEERAISLTDKLKGEYDSLSEPNLNPISVAVLEDRYLKKTEKGRFLEKPKDCLFRVARVAAMVEAQYGKIDEEVVDYFKSFYNVMANCDFMPNSPTLMNAGMALGQLSACFVLPIEDEIANELEEGGIFDTVKATAIVHKSGGGTGFSFSRIRPHDDFVKTTYGKSSGVLSFMKVFNSATEEINQGGFRRGANMGVLRVDHPQIIEWINAKTDGTSFNNFNISVAVTDKFLEAYKTDGEYELVNPRNGKVTGKLRAREVIALIEKNAHEYGEPGIMFLDRMNRDNPTPHIGEIESTNPCGEQPLLPHEACNLGSINIDTCVTKEGEIDYEKLGRLVRTSVRFLDNIIDASNYPKYEIAEMVGGNRKIGMGIMGLTDALIRMGIPYDSKEAVEEAGRIMKFVQEEGHKASQELGKEKGNFSNFKGSVYDGKVEYMRNATVTTIAPTGSISLIANNTSSGIEPLFRVQAQRTITGSDTTLVYMSQAFEYLMRKADLKPEDFTNQIVKNNGSIQGIEGIPEEIQRLCKISGEIHHDWHFAMQEAIQEQTDNAVSKTVNFFADEPREKVAELIQRAINSKVLKGLTVYREGSREDVISSGKGIEELVFFNIEKPGLLMEKPLVWGFKIEIGSDEKIHPFMSCSFYRHKETGKIYAMPYEIFQLKRPIGHKENVRFAQSGVERSRILVGADPDFAEFIEDLKSVRETEWGLGPKKTFGQDYSVGVALEYVLRTLGIIGSDKTTGRIVNLIQKSDLEPITDMDEKREIQKRFFHLRGNFKGAKELKYNITEGIKKKDNCPICGKPLVHDGGCHGGRCPDGHVDSC